jgi:hypothetical protein
MREASGCHALLVGWVETAPRLAGCVEAVAPAFVAVLFWDAVVEVDVECG